MRPALKILLEEHAALTSALHALRAAARARADDKTPDFELLRSMLFYMDAMPTRVHRAIKAQLFFKIRERCPPLQPVLERLENEHTLGDRMVQSLHRALTAWQLDGAKRRETFELLLCVYVNGYLGHIEVEENYVLPVAQDYLFESDWREFHVAFACHRGKLAAAAPESLHAMLRRTVDQ